VVRISGPRFVAYVLAAYAAVIFGFGEGFRLEWFLACFAKFVKIAFPTWGVCCAALLVGAAVREFRTGEPRRPLVLFRDLAIGQWYRDRFWALVWPPLLFIALLGLYGLFKQRVLVDAPFRFDPLFYRLDRAIWGTDPWRLSHPSPFLTEFLGAAYYGWYAPMMLGTLAACMMTNRIQLRDRYITAFVLTWVIVGSVMAFLLPAAGPCYWSEFIPGPNPYAELMQQIRQDVATSASYNPVLDAQAYLLHAHGGHTVMGGGISAMPSMHVAAATLFACGAWQLNRLVGIGFAIFAGIIWWASVHLGWHYFVDGLVAIPATLAIWWLCGKLYPEETETEREGHPAFA
jgi:hypothetical protein